MARRRAGLLLVLLLWPGLAAGQTSAPPIPSPSPSVSPISLEEALLLARANPAITAARLRRAVDQAGIDIARERPNPEARYEHTNELPRDAFSVAQLIELGGKRGHRIALAEAAARTGEAELAQTEAEVTADVYLAFFGLAGTQRRLEVARELAQIAVRAREAASARYEVGDVSRLDVLQADLALYQAENDAAAVEGEQAGARAELNVLIGREVNAPTVAAEPADTSVPAPVDATVIALQSNTALAVLDRQVAEAQARAALARAQRTVDPTIEGTVTHGAEPEFTWGYRAAVAVVVPLFTRHNAAVHQEEATLALLAAQREAMAQRIRGAVASAAFRAAAAREQYRRYRDDILPRSREVEAMAQESYRAGQTNLVALLQSLQSARELRAKSLQAAADFENALASLRQAMTAPPK
ncbi:MAG TPA: TolC family protein [Vicinamibacteria bacterium]|nr:TolC family protein [Vicinamibacteria bacterium]